MFVTILLLSVLFVNFNVWAWKQAHRTRRRMEPDVHPSVRKAQAVPFGCMDRRCICCQSYHGRNRKIRRRGNAGLGGLARFVHFVKCCSTNKRKDRLHSASGPLLGPFGTVDMATHAFHFGDLHPVHFSFDGTRRT